jgi:hypothetical protein
VDKNRRKFIKIVLIGSASFIVGKILGPLFSRSLDNPFAKTNLPVKTKSGTFRIVENKKILSVYDNSGEEIFQIDKGA